MLAYSYRRFSSLAQEQGNSLLRQTQLAEEWSKRTGIKLDKSLSLSDLGISAFKGKNISDTSALGEFISLVNKGRIAKGSYLLIENLDRLSRQEIKKGLSLLLHLIENSIKVIQLSPYEKEFNQDTDMPDLMMAIMELSRGHSESAMKSERISKAWSAKKKAAASGKLLTKRIPKWLSVEGGKICIIPTAQKTIKKIFSLCISGYSQLKIYRFLNANLSEYPVIGPADHWANSSVAKILHNEAVIGVYQPYKLTDAGRVKDGSPINNYFPPVISQADWLAAKACLQQRKEIGSGRTGKHINLLKGLLRYAEDDSGIHYKTEDKRSPAVYELAAYEARKTVLGAYRFPVSPLVASVLWSLKELNINDLVDKPDNTADDLLVTEGRLIIVNKQLEDIEQKLLSGQSVEFYSKVIDKLSKDKDDLAKLIAYFRQKQNNPIVSKLVEAQDLASQYTQFQPYTEEFLLKLQSAIRNIISKIHCFFVRKGRKQEAFLVLSFKDSEKRRFVHCKYKPPQRGNKARPTDIPVSFVVGFSDKLPTTLEVPSREVAELLAEWPE